MFFQKNIHLKVRQEVVETPQRSTTSSRSGGEHFLELETSGTQLTGVDQHSHSTSIRQHTSAYVSIRCTAAAATPQMRAALHQALQSTSTATLKITLEQKRR